jgi:hypothetical protein
MLQSWVLLTLLTLLALLTTFGRFLVLKPREQGSSRQGDYPFRPKLLQAIFLPTRRKFLNQAIFIIIRMMKEERFGWVACATKRHMRDSALTAGG